MLSRRHKGFTLVELVIVIVITGIVAAVAGVIIQGSVGAYVDQERRASLVADADRAMRRMSREIRQALPNSIRNSDCLGGNECVEFLSTLAGGRYREGPGPGVAQPQYRLSFNQPDSQFNAMGPETEQLPSGANLRIAVYNTGQAGNNAWIPGSPGPISGPGFSINPAAGGVVGEVNVQLNNPHQFQLASPRQRFYVVEGPVAFVCEGRQLIRYHGYAIGNAYTGGQANVLANNIDECGFVYQSGSSTRAGLLTIELVFEEEGERVRLQHQVQVSNAP